MKSTTVPGWLRELPNQITFFRIGVVPVLLLLYPLEVRALRIFCALLFLVASGSDWLDGFLARRYGCESTLGSILDPLADKMLVGAGLLLVCASEALYVWAGGLLLCRELGISGLRLIAAQAGLSVPVGQLGKWKTLFLDAAIFGLLINSNLWGLPMRTFGMVCLWVALGLSLSSAYLYFVEFWDQYSPPPAA